ncbi:transporter substrate-binding domain-containing protein [Streptomyces sp. NPDC048172]|uniref:transporter substrate-binding domain-containing protein n=1 Tax=Streptomyces sp. NPDC048172 TaxID=3365505 RepID=UPI0037164C3B
MTRTRRRIQAARTWLVLAAVAALVPATACTGEEGADGEPTVLPPQGTVHIATAFDQPGFDLYRNHRHRGFDMDLAYYLGEKLGFNAKFQDVTHQGRERELDEEGEHKRSADMVIATYSITPQRDKKIDFVGPYLTSSQGFLVRKGYHGIKKERDLKGKLVCAVEGTTPTAAGMPTSTVMKEEADYSTCVRKLQERSVDAVFSDEVILFGYAQQQEKSEVPLKVVPNVTMGLINRYGIGIPKDHPTECRRLLKVLRKYLIDEWSSDFQSQLPALVDTYPDDWQNRFKPDPEDLNTYSSCRA